MNNPYAQLMGVIRDERATDGNAAVRVAGVVRMDPMCIRLDGTELTRNLYRLEGATYAEGDEVAILNMGEGKLILGKVARI